MTQIPPQAVQLTCPNCNSQFQSQLFTIVDVTQQPELKNALLNGQLNVAVCPNCNFSMMLGAPLVYHDLEKKLCLVYIPQELNLSAEQEEKLIGDHTSILMQTLPPDAPRGHLLTPKRMMSLGSLVDTVLEADGIPREVLEQQRKRVELISQFAEAMGDEAQFARLVEQHKAELTPEFFATIDAFMQASAQGQRDDSSQMLAMLRQRLVELTGFSGGGPMPGGEHDPDVQQAVDRLVDADEARLEEVIAELRPIIDYSLFQALTERIDQAQREGRAEDVTRLTARRQQVLETVERMDKEAQAMFEAGTNILREALEASDMEAALRAHSDAIDDAFMLVLTANISQAQRAGQHEMEARLNEVNRLAIEIIQEKLSPEERFINQLMLAESAEERRGLLRGNAQQVTPDFVKKLNELASEHEQRGVKANADQLRVLAREAGAMLY